MNNKRNIIAGIVLVLAVAAGGLWWWGSQAQAAAGDTSLEATGVIEARRASLAPEVGGQVLEVLVEAGQRVTTGQPLVKLDAALLVAQRDQAQAALQAAQANYDLLAAGASDEELAAAQVSLALAQANPELVLAQQALDDLYENTDLAAAQAQLAVARAEEQLDDARRALNNLHNPDLEWYQDQVEDAQEALATASEDEELIDISEELAGVQAAQDNVDKFRSIVEAVEKGIAECVVTGDTGCAADRVITVDNIPWTLDDAQDALNDALNALRQAEIRLDQARRANDNKIEAAQDWLEDAQADLNWALRDPAAIDLALAEADMAVAEAGLADARRQWEAVRAGPDPDLVAVAETRLAAAEASLAAAQAQLNLVEAGARSEQLAAAQAQVDTAQAQLDALDVQLEKHTLTAPWDGVVLTRSAESGETVMPAAALLEIARLDLLELTVYLPEDRFGLITPGQEASVRVDAYPDRIFSGTVLRVADEAEFTPTNIQTKEERVRLVYAVVISLDNPDLALKPGMIADVDFG